MRKSKRWRIIKGGICVVAVSSAVLFMHNTLSPQGLSEDDIVVDEMNMCYVDDDSPYYRRPEDIAMPPLVFLDKLSNDDDVEVDEEIFSSYPEHYPHTEYFEGPEVEDNPRSPIGKWVGKGLLRQPFGLNPYRWNNKHGGCKIKGASRVDAPSTLWLMGIFPLLFLFRKEARNEETN